MTYYKRKTESLTGVVTGKVYYKGGEEGGKQSFLLFNLYIDNKSKKEMRKLKAFGLLADTLCYLSDGDSITVSVYRTNSGDDIIEACIEDSKTQTTPIRQNSLMSEDALRAKNKELATLGLVLVPIKTATGQILAQKKLSDCFKAGEDYIYKLEYILDTLGANRVMEALKEAGIGGELNLTRKFAETYKELKNSLFKEALEQ